MTTNDKLTRFYSFKENWGGNDCSAPSPVSIESARDWIRRFEDEVLGTDYVWIDPHVSADEEGRVTFEWWNYSKKLTIYIDPIAVWCIQVWGLNIETEMSYHDLMFISDWLDCWHWLFN